MFSALSGQSQLTGAAMDSRLKTRSMARRMVTVSLLLAGLISPIAAGSMSTVCTEDAGFSSERLRAVHDTIQRHIDAAFPLRFPARR